MLVVVCQGVDCLAEWFCEVIIKRFLFLLLARSLANVCDRTLVVTPAAK
jgi:hypothetical protein